MHIFEPGRVWMIAMLASGGAFACSAGSAPGSSIAARASGGSPATASGGASANTGSAGSPTSSEGGGVSILTDSGANGGATAPTDTDAACSAVARDSTPIAVDLFMMIDRSVSMKCGAADTGCDNPGKNVVAPTRWKAVTDSLTAFMSAPSSTGIGAGVGFFSLPDPNFCNVAAYATPAAAIAPLPASAAAITSAIAMTTPAATTPTEPALQGAINYAKSYTLATPGRTAAVVFVTDGLPNGCNSTVAGAAAIAQAAFTGTPPIKTYVVGLGATAGLDTIALAGSGGALHYFSATGDVTAMLSAALKQITTQAIGCDYAIPTTGNALDYEAVNVQVTVGATGTPAFVGKVDSVAQCSALGGWYYDVNPPGVPTKLTLCPQSCGPLAATVSSKLQVLFGCASMPPQPPK
jgi:hypothetical protein